VEVEVRWRFKKEASREGLVEDAEESFEAQRGKAASRAVYTP
jgi:hypothetical protein